MKSEDVLKLFKESVDKYDKKAKPYLINYGDKSGGHQYVIAIGNYEADIEMLNDNTYNYALHDLYYEMHSTSKETLNNVDDLRSRIDDLVKLLEDDEQTNVVPDTKVQLDIRLIYSLLEDEDITGYRIEQETGLSRQLMSNLRNNKQQIESLSITNAYLLQNFYIKALKQREQEWLTAEALEQHIQIVEDDEQVEFLERKSMEWNSIVDESLESLALQLFIESEEVILDQYRGASAVRTYSNIEEYIRENPLYELHTEYGVKYFLDR